MRLNLWPQSLFGRLIAASVLAVLVAEAFALVLIAHERGNFVLQGNVREWARRIGEITFMLQPLSASEREAAISRLIEQPHRFPRLLAGGGQYRRRGPGLMPEDLGLPRSVLPGAGEALADPSPSGGSPSDRRPSELPPGGRIADRGAQNRGPPDRGDPTPYIMVRLPLAPDFEPALKQQLQTTLGSAYTVSIEPTTNAARRAIPIPTPFFEPRDGSGMQLFDITVGFPDGDASIFRIANVPRGVPLSRNLFVNLVLLVLVLMVALYASARSITRPLSNLVRAAESLGRNVRQPKLEEKGSRELRDAARAFNTMQDRLQRYLDSRTRVLAAMSHDLKTPLTRLRLQVETALEDSAIQARFSKELDEMESMVRGALALFRGLDDDETFTPIDINALLATLQSEFTEMGAEVTVEGKAGQLFTGKPQALKRCLTNLIANAIKFGVRAKILVEDGIALVIRVRDEGPGIPPEELERVFEPFYRVESSRNRDTGGTGLGLSIARDVAQAHGGSLVAQNLPGGGLEALLVLPRSRPRPRS
jgi:signal transduction histidine kinase